MLLIGGFKDYEKLLEFVHKLQLLLHCRSLEFTFTPVYYKVVDGHLRPHTTSNFRYSYMGVSRARGWPGHPNNRSASTRAATVKKTSGSSVNSFKNAVATLNSCM